MAGLSHRILALVIIIGSVVGLGAFFVSFWWPKLLSLPVYGPDKGTVVDHKTGQPISGAMVTWEWWCHNNPLPDGPGHFTVSSRSDCDHQGRFQFQKPDRPGGLFGCSYNIRVLAPGYIEKVLLLDPKGVPLPPSTVSYPFIETSTQDRFPASMEIRLQPALPVLLKEIKGPNPQFRSTAAEFLAGYGHEAQVVVPALIKALSDEDPGVRTHVATSLGRLGPVARSAEPALKAALQDKNEQVREAVAQAIKKISPKK